MSDQRIQQVLKNVFYGFSTWLLPLGLAFVVTPVIVRSLGNHEYGIYALVLGFVAYSFNFSIGRAITKYLAEYRAAGETEKIRDMVSATLLVNLAVGIIAVAAVVGASRWLATDVFAIEEAWQSRTIDALRVSALIIFFLMIGQVFNAVLQGLHRYDVFAKIFNANNIVLMLGNLLLAVTGFGLRALLYWNLAVTAVSATIVFFAARKLLPEMKLGLRVPSDALRTVVRYSSGVVGYQIAANALLLFERGWIMSSFGAEALTFYVVPMMLGIYLHSFLASLTMVIFPLASELERDIPRLKRLYFRATKITGFIVFFLAASLIALSGPLLNLWVGPEFERVSTDLLILLTLSFGLTAMLVIAFTMAEGVGRTGLNFAAILVALIVAVPLMVSLSATLGLEGVAIARLVAFALFFSSAFVLEYLVFGAVQAVFWLRTVGYLLPTAVIIGTVERYIANSLGLSWVSIAAAFVAGGIAYFSILYFFRFATDEDRAFIVRIFNRA